MPARKRTPGIYARVSKRTGLTVYDAVAHVDGRQKWSRGHATPSLARAEQDQMRADMRRGMLGKAPARMTVGDLVTKLWLPSREVALQEVRNSVLQCRWAAHHIDAALGKVRLAKLTPQDVEQWLIDLSRAGLSATSRHLLFARLKEVLTWAVNHDMIYRNVCAPVKSPRKGTYAPPDLDLETIARILQHAEESPVGLLVWMAAMTGLRWSELSRLTWSAVDVHDATLRLGRGKTASSRRPVALGPAAVARLQAHRIEQLRVFTEMGMPPPQTVFLNDDGLPMSRAWRNKHWYVVRSRAGVAAMHFHDLRHVHATLLARAGVHPSVMAERLGHADASLSLNVYTHVSAGQQVDAAAAVEALISTRKVAGS